MVGWPFDSALRVYQELPYVLLCACVHRGDMTRGAVRESESYLMAGMLPILGLATQGMSYETRVAG